MTTSPSAALRALASTYHSSNTLTGALETIAQQVQALEKALTEAPLVGAYHRTSEDCPSWYDRCNCTVENYAGQLERTEALCQRVKEMEARLAEVTRTAEEFKAETKRLKKLLDVTEHIHGYQIELDDALDDERPALECEIKKAIKRRDKLRADHGEAGMTKKLTKAQRRVLSYLASNGPVKWWPIAVGPPRPLRHRLVERGWMESVKGDGLWDSWVITEAGRRALTEGGDHTD